MRTALLAIALFAAGCSKSADKKSDDKPATTPDDKTAVETGAAKTVEPKAVTPAQPEASTSTTVPPLKATAAPGKAYLVVDPTGIVEIDQGKVAHRVTLPDGHDKYARSMARTASGDLIVDAVGNLYQIKKGKVSNLTKAPIGLHGQLLSAPDGSLWTWTITTVGHYAGKDWTEIKNDSLGDSGFVGMTIAKDGTVWLAAQKQLFKWDGSAFKPVALPAIGNALLQGLVSANDGKVYLATTSGIVDVTAASPTPLKVKDISVGPQLVAGPEGRIAMFDHSGKITVLVPPSELVTYPKLPAHAEAVAFDGAGRLWASTKAGLVVYDASGKQISFPTGTLPMLGGKITEIVVEGGGPQLPVAGEVERGRIKGTVSSAGGSALAGAKVEICAEAKMMYQQGKSPCADEPFNKQTTSNQDGEFVFDEVPVGTWSFAVLPKAGDKWIITFRNFCSSMKKGETCNAPLQLR
jgi:hypothetical protein